MLQIKSLMLRDSDFHPRLLFICEKYLKIIKNIYVITQNLKLYNIKIVFISIDYVEVSS